VSNALFSSPEQRLSVSQKMAPYIFLYNGRAALRKRLSRFRACESENFSLLIPIAEKQLTLVSLIVTQKIRNFAGTPLTQVK